MNSKMRRFRRRMLAIFVGTLILGIAGIVNAQDATPEPTPEPTPAVVETTTDTSVEEPVVEVPEVPVIEEVLDPLGAITTSVSNMTVSIDTMWVFMTGFLVFFMQTGFALLEAGLVRQTGVVNALLENFIDAGLTAIIFWAVGFGIAFGTDAGGLIGTDNFFLAKAFEISNGNIVFNTITQANGDIAYPNLSVLTFFFFQFAFAATASTITTGAMAERTDYVGDLIYTGIMAAFTYPVVVHWVWGGGWLADNWFLDFAGGTVVHTVGGVTALIGAWMLGPRANRKFGEFPPAHNMALATLGTMILWFGWYGFNPGSTLGAGNTNLIGLVTLNTTLGAGAGAVVAMFFIYFRTGRWDLVFTLNGSLAGLVAVTPGCAFVTPTSALIIGGLGGIFVYFGVEIIESLKIDDPVGAFAVHAVNGIWGTIAIGLFAQSEIVANATGGLLTRGGLLTGGGTEQLMWQLIGSGSTILWVTVTSFVMFGALKMINRLRVDKVADAIGIDAYEHQASAWPDV
ncbi:MAG TPA: ammonium transporter, partial [Aggregatilineales bacterium]|nr:ammonium transporter [Aggregatilineales bacterium]